MKFIKKFKKLTIWRAHSARKGDMTRAQYLFPRAGAKHNRARAGGRVARVKVTLERDARVWLCMRACVRG